MMVQNSIVLNMLFFTKCIHWKNSFFLC